MRTLTAAQMREADRRCIEELGIPGAVLMNAAGQSVFREIDRGPVGIVCGKGNNAGDAYVAGRYLIAEGYTVVALQVVPIADCSPLCQQNHAPICCRPDRQLPSHIHPRLTTAQRVHQGAAFRLPTSYRADVPG